MEYSSVVHIPLLETVIIKDGSQLLFTPTVSTAANDCKPPVPSDNKSSCMQFYNNPCIAKKISSAFKNNAIAACQAFDEGKYNKVRKSLQEQYLNKNPIDEKKFSPAEHKAIHDEAYRVAGCNETSAHLVSWEFVDRFSFREGIIRKGVEWWGPCDKPIITNPSLPTSKFIITLPW